MMAEGDGEVKKHLDLVVGQPRFLIFPWVRVHCLASKALSMAARQLPADWQQRHGTRPVLLETFVHSERFRGTCYRAANWQRIGQTKAAPTPGAAPRTCMSTRSRNASARSCCMARAPCPGDASRPRRSRRPPTRTSSRCGRT